MYFLLHGKELRVVFSSAEWFGTEFRQFVSIFFHGTEFRVVFSSAEGFGREFSEYSSIFVSTERNSELFSLPLKCSEGNSESSLLFLFNGTEFRVVFYSVEWFGTEFREFASILVPRNGIPSCVLFRRRVRNRIMGVCFYFCSTEQNSELFSLPRKGSERNSEIFCSAEQPEFRRK